MDVYDLHCGLSFQSGVAGGLLLVVHSSLTVLLVVRQIPNVVDRALQEAGIGMEQELDQTQFVDVYRKAALALVKYLKAKPVTVAHTEKVFDGSSISHLIKDKKALDLVSDRSSSQSTRIMHFLSSYYSLNYLSVKLSECQPTFASSGLAHCRLSSACTHPYSKLSSVGYGSGVGNYAQDKQWDCTQKLSPSRPGHIGTICRTSPSWSSA